MTLDQFLPANVFAIFLVFARTGSMLMLLPGFGEFYVMQRFRLLLAVIIAFLLAPLLAPVLPPLPANAPDLVMLIGGEVVIGIFLGTVSRVLLSALDTAGTVVSLQLGLSAAQIFNPLQAQPTAITSSFYGVFGVLLIFLTDLHHLLLRAMVESYDVFVPGALPPLGELSEAMVHCAGGAFRLGIEMAAPFIILGTMFFVTLGLIGRLVPQLQMLFVTQPLQIVGGLIAFAFVLASGMEWFLSAFAQQFAALTGT
jgi:flagellar biosynthetic protein FliR